MRESPRYRRLFDLRLGGRRRSAAEMDLELESHIAMREADLLAAGMTPEEARARACERFGDFEAARRRLRAGAHQRDAAMLRRDHVGSLVADLRYAWRQARRAPGFTLLAVLTLAVGIGATTAIFTLVDHVLLRPLPFPDPSRLVGVFGRDSTGRLEEYVSSADWLDYRKAKSFEASAIYGFGYRQGIVTTDSATRVDAEQVSGTFFDVLRPRFIAGRGFTESEALSGTPVVVISERLWRDVFGADPKLATPLRTAVRSYTIIGVVASGQEYPAYTDVWFPVALTPATDPIRVNVNWIQIARLAPGATIERAGAELTTIAHGIHAADPTAIYDFGATDGSLGDYVIGYASLYLKLLMGVVLFVLLIVSANVAAAGLARGAVRGREMAVRTSLGAGRGRLVQQLLVEHAWLGLLGGALGLSLAWSLVRLILARWGAQIPRAAEISLDGRIFLFALAVSLAAGVCAGLLPALRITRVSLRDQLASGSRAAARGGRGLAGATLVGAEIALALVLLTGAGLLIRSFRSLLGRDLGFDTNVATAEASLAGARYSTDSLRRAAYWTSLIDAYRGIPGVVDVAVTNWIPLGLTGNGFIEVAGRDLPGAGAVYRTVSEDYFRTLSIPLLMGRTFDRTEDGPATTRVVVINHRMAEQYWPGQNPIGKLVRASSMEGRRTKPADWLTVIGVVGDVRTWGLESEPRPEMDVLIWQVPGRTSSGTAVVRGHGRAADLLHEMRGRAHAVDPSLAIDLGTLDDRLRTTLSTRTLMLSLLTGFAAVALGLAALGVYGLLSYVVAQRTRELAVRSALGARRGQLLALVLGAGVRVIVPGIALGIVGAWWLARALSSMLVGVGAVDLVTYAAATTVLVLAAMGAVLVPSLRATRLNPAIALQAE